MKLTITILLLAAVGCSHPPVEKPKAGSRGTLVGDSPGQISPIDGLNQAISRDGVGVSNRAMLDAMKNPKEVVPQSNGTTLYIGQNAVVLTNAQGKVVTTWATNSSGQR